MVQQCHAKGRSRPETLLVHANRPIKSILTPLDTIFDDQRDSDNATTFLDRRTSGHLGKTVRSAVELVAKNSPLDIRAVETAVESGLDKIRDRLASDFELVKKTEYETNVELLEMLKNKWTS